ncbi:MAG: hypothetical protein WCX48_11735 [Bacteroidales bacterium]|jgi:hypothetical protein
MSIEIKELGSELCKTRRVCRKIRNNGKLNGIRVVHDYTENKIIDFDFHVLKKHWYNRIFFDYSVCFWGKYDVSTGVLRIGNVEEHLYEKIYSASKLLFEDIEELKVVIEKDFC